MSWLRLNLGLITLACGLTASVVGSLITGGIWIAHNESRIDTLASRLDAHDWTNATVAGQHQTLELRETALQTRMVESDARNAAAIADTRRQIDQGEAQLGQRIAVLELQTKMIAEFIRDTAHPPRTPLR